MNKDQKNYESNVSTGLNSVQTIYEGSVNARVVERAGLRMKLCMQIN